MKEEFQDKINRFCGPSAIMHNSCRPWQ